MHELFTEFRMPSSNPAETARLLVADDQPDVLEALRWLLTGEGYELELVSSTDAVMDRLRSGPFDLLLMDLNYTRDTTSGREGLELISRVRTHDSSLPIVVMTGWGSIDTAVEAMRRGAKSFVQKPWEDLTLIEIVEREVAEGRATRRRDHKQQREVEEARLIQRGLLPTATPQVSGIDLSVTWLPADGVGGDCFDTLGFGDVLGVSIADIAGKGLPAALLMSNLQAAVRAFAQEAVSPASINNSVNRLLCRNMASGRFATFCYARIEPRRPAHRLLERRSQSAPADPAQRRGRATRGGRDGPRRVPGEPVRAGRDPPRCRRPPLVLHGRHHRGAQPRGRGIRRRPPRGRRRRRREPRRPAPSRTPSSPT